MNRKRLFEIVEVANPYDSASKAFDLFIIALIIANVIALSLSTVSSLWSEYKTFFIFFEYFSIAIFTIEYLGRIYACVEIPKYSKTITG